MANPPQVPGTFVVPPRDPWDEAFSAYRQALVDLDGDGTPDALVPVPADNRERQMIARRAMSGREPALTPREQEALALRRQRSEENNQLFERGVGEMVLGQPVRAATAIGEAVVDPSIANVTNAGVQTALAAFRPMTAAKVAGGGFGAAAAGDMISGAVAQSPSRRQGQQQAVVADVSLPGLTPEQNSEYNALQAQMQRGNFGSAAQRRSIETRAQELRRLSDDFSRMRGTSAQQEYDSAVRRAETERDTILADRPKRFSETSIGQVYDKLGIVAPGVIAAGMGGLTRAGLAATGVTNTPINYLAPVAVGAATGGVAANYPLGHELMFAPAANPQRQAFDAYARELPPDHPRKQEWTQYANSLPTANPAREAASAEFYDPVKFAERSGLGVVEGVLGGLAGAEAVNIALRPFRSTTKSGGRRNDGPNQNDQGGNPQIYRQYGQVPADVRQQVQGDYLTYRALHGEAPSTQAGSQAVTNLLASRNMQAPVTPNRVANTNRAYDDFIVDFVRREGRMPTRPELMSIFNSRTLAIPLAAGAAAGPVSNLLAGYYGGD